ncbi:hypothetical protein RYX36_012431, partial [Vicia faba]
AILVGVNIKIIDGKVCQFICNGAYMTCLSSGDQHLNPTCGSYVGSPAYMICPSSGDQHLNPPCNCCLASTVSNETMHIVTPIYE